MQEKLLKNDKMELIYLHIGQDCMQVSESAFPPPSPSLSFHFFLKLS